MSKKFSALTLVIPVLILSACASSGTSPQVVSNSMEPQLKTTAIDRAMEKALADAQANGNAQEVLAILGQVQARNPKDPVVAIRYARALRDDEQINAAIRTLAPFTKGEKANNEAITEMAMTQLSLGDFEAAESYATRAIENDPNNARAYLALGTAQDAQSRHQDAEVSFREGLKHWQGDPSPILNNLALNLASQGHLEESLALLEKAQKLAPGRMDLERNRRIISTLLETTGPRPPAPEAKPSAKQEASDKPAPAPKPAKKAAPVKEKAAVKEEAKEEDQPLVQQPTPPPVTKTNIKLKSVNE
ncbi:MAG TPA: tetratricopeptide repeat protein [Alphaproteobacteria bacterium]|nr:tetratricopeptide repeat protein [Alphaproteobacteria bacterium]